MIFFSALSWGCGIRCLRATRCARPWKTLCPPTTRPAASKLSFKWIYVKIKTEHFFSVCCYVLIKFSFTLYLWWLVRSSIYTQKRWVFSYFLHKQERDIPWSYIVIIMPNLDIKIHYPVSRQACWKKNERTNYWDAVNIYTLSPFDHWRYQKINAFIE